MPTRTWNVKHNGHQLEVENYWSIDFIWNRHRSRLFIDGKCADEISDKGFFTAGQGSLETILRGQITDGDEIEVVNVKLRSGMTRVLGTIKISDQVIFEK